MTDSLTRPVPATLAPFQRPAFRAMWIATVVSNFGGLIQTVGAAWLMTTIATSADQVALVQSSSTLPILLFAIIAGALADIYDRRAVMIAAQLVMFAASVALAVVTGLNLITPWVLLALTFVIGSGQALYAPAWQASVGEQVPRDEIPQAVSLNSLGFNIARSLGPALGGIIVATAGAFAAFVLNAVSYIGLLTVLFQWRRPRTAVQLPPERIVPAIRAGVQYVRLSPPIRAILFRGMAFGSTGAAIWALLPLVARNLLNASAPTYGLLFGGIGLGAIAGALASHRLRVRLTSETAVRLYAVALGLAVILVAFSRSTLLSFLAMPVVGACWLLTISTCNITVQLRSPRWVVGRALSLFQMSVFGGMAIGSWVWGQVAEVAGLTPALTISGVLAISTVLLGLHFRLVQPEKVDLEPIRTDVDLDVAIPAGLEGAPVVLTVEYRIAPEEAGDFLEAMREKRRIRMRDGARRWTLMQDLADPEIWIERFQNPTWTDYLRQRNRGTIDDRGIEERVRAFHRGEEPPRVRRWVEHRPEANHPHDDGHELRQGPLH